MADDEIGRETAAALRTTLQVAGLLAEHWGRRTASRAQAATARHETRARESAARWQAQQRTAESYLRTTGSAAWWRDASRSDVTEAWCTARHWRHHSTVAATAEKRLNGQISERYGIDLTSTTPINAPADPAAIHHLLARAAWRQTLAPQGTPHADVLADDAATRRAEAEALYALVAEHARATSLAVDSTGTAVAEAGLEALGGPGQQWLREFDRAPHQAYARVLVAPDTATRTAIYDSAEKLRALANASEISDDDLATRTASELSAIDDLGEPARPWLEAWHADHESAYHHVLDNRHVQEELTKRAEMEFSAQSRTAEAELRGRTGKWFATAERVEILDAWDTARTWREHSPLAATVHDRLTTQILERFGVDLSADSAMDLAQARGMLDHAAWRVAAAKMDSIRASPAKTETEEHQRLEHDHLYKLVADHSTATSAYLAHGDNRYESASPGRDQRQRALAISDAEAELRDLGPLGQRWLRDFDTDPHRAYARVLVAPNSATRRQLHAAVQQLHDSEIVGPTRTPRPDRDNAIAAVGATGDSGRRWLDTWRSNPHAALHRVLEDPYTVNELRLAPAQPTARKTRRSRDARHQEPAPRPRSKAWTDSDLQEARGWLTEHDPEWLAVRDWKIANLPDTNSGLQSVQEAIVERFRSSTSTDPARRESARSTGITDHNQTERTTAIRSQLKDRNVDPALQRIRMNLEQDNAVPLSAVITKPPTPVADPIAVEPDMQLHQVMQDFDHDR
ncbi:hypothetical protein HLB23_28125 [Nocardia uniformis]|uniref:Uncharacterized protein n=1 Tax=Nocardia uniformis TaxID=53432 RepID=A0A849C4P7_9NOCA|nr:hypothetical protein [Nocardia uniformis]NNH73674.1 hypothetical protein [Nocardia uniformis]